MFGPKYSPLWVTDPEGPLVPKVAVRDGSLVVHLRRLTRRSVHSTLSDLFSLNLDSFFFSFFLRALLQAAQRYETFHD